MIHLIYICSGLGLFLFGYKLGNYDLEGKMNKAYAYGYGKGLFSADKTLEKTQ